MVTTVSITYNIIKIMVIIFGILGSILSTIGLIK